MVVVRFSDMVIVFSCLSSLLEDLSTQYLPRHLLPEIGDVRDGEVEGGAAAEVFRELAHEDAAVVRVVLLGHTPVRVGAVLVAECGTLLALVFPLEELREGAEAALVWCIYLGPIL